MTKSVESSVGLSTAVGKVNKVKKKILLVDDVKLFLELEKTFFQRKAAFEVMTAGSGKEAIKIVDSEQPDLIFMDLYMPEMDGDECCRLIKDSEGGKSIPVVMVTSAGNEEDRARCLAAGCNEIITKPVNRSHFHSVAKKYIEVHERKEPRYASHIKVMFGQHRDELSADYSVNLSTSGLFLSSPNLYPVNTRLFLEMNLPDIDKAVCCQSRVAWVNEADKPLKRDLPVGMGLKFDNILPAETDVIRGYIDNNTLSADW